MGNMSDCHIVFSPRAKQRLEEIADYLFQQNLSNQFVIDYLNQFENWLMLVVGQFPESGRLMPELGENIRRLSYREYSFIYRYQRKTVEILTIYRENLPGL